MRSVRKYTSLIFLIILIISFTSCREKDTENPVEVYNLWGGEIPKEVQVFKGKYWQSSHWTKEYIMYLELQASTLWRKEFIKQNNLIGNKENEGIPADAPNWFKPSKKYRVLTRSGFNEGSVYYEDTISGKMFIYEKQL